MANQMRMPTVDFRAPASFRARAGRKAKKTATKASAKVSVTMKATDPEETAQHQMREHGRPYLPLDGVLVQICVRVFRHD